MDKNGHKIDEPANPIAVCIVARLAYSLPAMERVIAEKVAAMTEAFLT